MVILLAEQDMYIRFSDWKVLKQDGFTVLAVGNGETAIETSRNYPGAIDLLITGAAMPSMSGPELFRQIEAERPRIKALMLTGNPDEQAQASSSGLPYLQRPLTAETLRTSLKTVGSEN